jgi:hypothetical protein
MSYCCNVLVCSLGRLQTLIKKNTEILIRHPQVHIEWNFEQNISYVTVRVSFQQLHYYTVEDDLQLTEHFATSTDYSQCRLC